MSKLILITTLLAYFALLLFIAWLTARRGSGNQAFFRGSQSSPWLAVSFGMIGASISGVTFVSVPGMVQSIDLTYLQTCMGFFFGYVLVAKVLLPLYYKSGVTSIYSYLETRFGPHTYHTGAAFFVLSRMTGAAARLYLVCLILYNFVFASLGVPFWVLSAGIIVCIWLYTHKSGIATIVWTDTMLTFCLLGALIWILIAIMGRLDLSFSETWQAVTTNPHFRIFEFNDWQSKQHFVKQFLSGVFIVIVMTGLDQDMMQKNLSCRTLKASQKNMILNGSTYLPVNFLFLVLGILLLLVAQKEGFTLPDKGDEILPFFAASGILGVPVLILFTVGIIAAAFSSADSALTALTTSICVDFLGLEKKTNSPSASSETTRKAIRLRHKVHIGVSICILGFILAFKAVDNKSVIDTIYTLCGYTYGPLLGFYAFGLYTHRTPRDRWVPLIAISSPLLCGVINYIVSTQYGYTFGYELLMLNGFLTFAGLWGLAIKNRKLKPIPNGY